MIYQKRLKLRAGQHGHEYYPTISYAKETFKVKYIFPFFTRRLKVVCLMVETKDKGLLFIKPIYFRYKVVNFMPTFTCHQPLKEIPAATIITNQLLKDTYHFDPWWILKKRTDVSPELKGVITQTNIAGMKLKSRKIIDICFNDSLTLIEGIKVKLSFFTSELIDRNKLILNKPIFEK